jgi:hypothetical protein
VAHSIIQHSSRACNEHAVSALDFGCSALKTTWVTCEGFVFEKTSLVNLTGTK